MLVKFRSSTSGEVIMFAEHARRLFDVVGKEGSARGVFTREQLADAIGRLRRAVEAEKIAARLAAQAPREADADAGAAERDDDEEEREKKAAAAITLAQRAQPLIQLMERTDKEEGFILWEAAKDF